MIHEYSDLFFVYNLKKYFFNANIFSYKDKNKDTKEPIFSLINSNIISFEYVNEFNKLYLDGTLIYYDNHGILDKFLEKTTSYILILFSEMKLNFDGDIVIEKMSDNAFIHTFLINSIKILERKNHIITYKLLLVSLNMLNCIENILYSNYNREPEQIFDIIKAMLSMSDLVIDTESFSKVKSPCSINYITNGNDNVLTTVEYLLSKLYYYDLKDISLKFIIYNDIENKYHLFDITDPTMLLGKKEIVISLFKSNFEDMMLEEPNELNSVTKTSKILSYKYMFNKIFYDFNYNTANFIDKTIKSDKIVNYINNKIDGDNLTTKIKFLADKIKYKNNGSYWNNDFNIYANLVKILLEDSSIVVNTTGEILCKPGYYVNLHVDRDLKYIKDEDIENYNDLKDKYRTFEGLWIVSKVRHIIIPSELETNKKRYRQNLVLVRNFIHG